MQQIAAASKRLDGLSLPSILLGTFQQQGGFWVGRPRPNDCRMSGIPLVGIASTTSYRLDRIGANVSGSLCTTERGLIEY